ncbi:MAG: hypothetical protein H6Q67_1250 [Firmicutes bacterium]|nr:hypothetical protein [Bacillota bacterium]
MGNSLRECVAGGARRREQGPEFDESCYSALRNFIRLREEIKRVLPLEMRSLVDRMASEYRLIHPLEKESGYCQGFHDAVKLVITHLTLPDEKENEE